MPADATATLHIASQLRTTMDICPVSPSEYAEFVAFLNAGMRPTGRPTRAVDDFPVILSERNLTGFHGMRDKTGWIAGLAVLTRPFETTVGTLRVAGVGSVVTRTDCRGRGYSGRLQRHVLDHLTAQEVPLAVLWSDRPEIYAGRGFAPAGWEFHLELGALSERWQTPDGAAPRELNAADIPQVVGLYERHPLRTHREPDDHAELYGMPGTRGLGIFAGDRLLAYAFCGKGDDFPDYVTEWGGEVEAVLRLLAAVAARGFAAHALVPVGREDVLERAAASGARFAAVPSGLWVVLRPDVLESCIGRRPEGDPSDAASWLGRLTPDGQPVEGLLQTAVWGFDSV